jgi:hypothetical protein
MLFTSTMLFVGFTVWTAVGWMRGVLAHGTRRDAQRQRARARTQFLLAFFAALVLIYTVYLVSR